jgi:hypothetical protein
VLLAIADPLFHSLLRQTTLGGREVQTDRTLDHLLARLCEDMEGAGQVAALGAEGADGNFRLAFEQPLAEVLYDFSDGRVVRYTREHAKQDWRKDAAPIRVYYLPGPEEAKPQIPSDAAEAGAWDVPNAVIAWRAWPDANAPQALEVRTSVWTGEGRARRQALARTHLFFPLAYYESRPSTPAAEGKP